MTSNVIGIICAVAIVVCGLGCYFIGRTQGIEWALQNVHVEVSIKEVDEEDPDEGCDT